MQGRDTARGLVSPRPELNASDAALLLPRLALGLPARFMGLVFFPVQQGLRAVDRHAVLHRIESLFVVASDESDPEGAPSSAVVLPIATWSSHFGATFGVGAFDEDIGGHGEQLAGKATLGVDGDRVAWLGFSAARAVGSPLWIELRWLVQDHPAVPLEDQGLFRERTFEEESILGASLGDGDAAARLGVRGRVAHHRPGLAEGAGPGERVLGTDDFERLAGFADGATVAELGGAAEAALLDQRLVAALAVGRAEVRRGGGFVRVRGAVRGVVDVLPRGRRLVLGAQLDSIEAPDGDVPVLELPSLGGPDRLRGHPLRSRVDRSSLLLTADYSYPVHQLLTGALHLDVGEVAPRAGALFTDPAPHLGGGAGFRIGRPGRPLVTVDVSGGDGVQVVVALDPLEPFVERRPAGGRVGGLTR